MNVPRVKFDECGAVGVRVDGAGPDGDVAVAGAGEERVQFAADERVAAACGLEAHLAVDGGVGMGRVGVEEGRSVVAFDDGECAAGAQQSP